MGAMEQGAILIGSFAVINIITALLVEFLKPKRAVNFDAVCKENRSELKGEITRELDRGNDQFAKIHDKLDQQNTAVLNIVQDHEVRISVIESSLDDD